MIEFRYHTPEETEYTTLSTEAVTTDDILEACERFLRACGFSLPEGAHIGYEYEDYLEGGKYPPPEPPDADGWIPWHGGECPVDDDVIVDVEFGFEGVVETGAAENWCWRHTNGGGFSDIIAYRLSPPTADTGASVEQNCKENTPEPPAGTASYRHGGTRITDCDVKSNGDGDE